MIKLASFVLVSLYLTGCSGYQAMSSTGKGIGYQEAKLGESSYQLRYADSVGFLSQQEAWQRIDGFWNQRATELCQSNAFSKSNEKRSNPCQVHLRPRGDSVIREKRCLLELSARLSC